eukprot:gnl/Hemi2/8952_TR3105_c0_g3_i1.p1 gnl/Hemi2/8952_TR3105_c0_g3~~gnl/Hemi2/8952_TR3105_c0_g3_i1.p1  ORF type:complete len:195 (-),score=56.50 gnl/Hemi2/8952_TR3105_c0_g3_i1:39-623(-)
MWVDDSTEEVPLELSAQHNNEQFLSLYPDKRTARYHGKGNRSNDVGALQAVRPCPSRRRAYYFEMTVLNHGEFGRMSIGLTDVQFDTSRQPGYEANSFGYLSEEGRKFNGSTLGRSYGPKFSAGDTVGCGIHFARQEIFFTHNGRHLGTAFGEVEGEYFPTVSLHSTGEVVFVNFGQLPFKFDFHSYLLVSRLL